MRNNCRSIWLVIALVLWSILAVIPAVGEAQSSSTPLKVALITPQRLGDTGPVDRIYSGLMRGAQDFNFRVQVVETRRGEYEESVRAMAEFGFEVIVVLFADFIDALERVAPDYPNTKFIIAKAEVDLPNVRAILSKDEEGSFLAGALAGMMTKTNRVGFIGGVDDAEINRFLAGYQHGAEYVNPNIQVDYVYVGGFEDPTKAKELALLLYRQGNDVIYHAAAKSGLGMFEAARETGKYAIGVDVNQNHLVPGQVLGSMEIYYDEWMYQMLREVREGTFEGGIQWLELRDGAIDFTIATPEQIDIPEDVRRRIVELRDKIINGEIQVRFEPNR